MTKSNGSFTTSQLPQALNAVSTDRILMLFNANSNNMISNGSPSTRTISMANIITSINNITAANFVVTQNSSGISLYSNNIYNSLSFSAYPSSINISWSPLPPLVQNSSSISLYLT